MLDRGVRGGVWGIGTKGVVSGDSFGGDSWFGGIDEGIPEIKAFFALSVFNSALEEGYILVRK